MNDLFGKIVQRAIDRIKEFEPPEGYYVAYSGGKDSDCIINLVRMAGVKYDAHHHLTTCDPPEIVYHVREQPDVEITKKEGGGSGRLVVTGVRWGESHRRSKRRMVEHCMTDKTKIFLHPIIDWTDSEVWEFIRGNNIKYCSLYDEGFKRS